MEEKEKHSGSGRDYSRSRNGRDSFSDNHNSSGTFSGSRYGSSSFFDSLDMDSILRDICRQWWVILIAAAAAALIAGTYAKITYKPQYTATATFVISKSGVSSNTVSDSLSAASALAETFTTVVDSEILESRVCTALGIDSLDGDISVSVVESTSLMTLTVNTSSPWLAYEVIQATMDAAVDLCGEVSENITIRVLQEPSIPTRVSNPLDVTGIMEKVGGAALVLMIVLFAMLSAARNTVKSERDFRHKVDAKLLAAIPHEQKYKTLAARVRHPHYSLFIENPTLSFGYVEACRMMGTRVRRELDRMGGDILMVTSVSENEGKSTVAANLAMAMNQEGRRAVLIDCDFRKPAQYKILSLPKEKEAENDLGSALKSRGTVHVTPAGMKKNLPVVFSTVSHKRLLNRETTESLEAIIRALRQTADYVILDTSPMGLVAESTQVAALADACLLVVEQVVGDARLINDAFDQLGDTCAKVLCCVFNDVHTGFFAKAGTYGSYYGYGRSYGYGRYGYGRNGYGRYGHYAYGHYGRQENPDNRADEGADRSNGKSADSSPDESTNRSTGKNLNKGENESVNKSTGRSADKSAEERVSRSTVKSVKNKPDDGDYKNSAESLNKSADKSSDISRYTSSVNSSDTSSDIGQYTSSVKNAAFVQGDVRTAAEEIKTEGREA